MARYPLSPWIAHRGGGCLAPENTLEGFRLAARLGFQAVEFDVMLTRDQVPILIHDETLERTTDGRGGVAERDWDELADLDAGRWLHRSWSGARIPRLTDVLALCTDLGLGVNVEIKPAAGHDEATGRLVAEGVAAAWPATLPLVVSSFSEAALAAARDAVPEQPRALLVEAIPGDFGARLARLDCAFLHARAVELTVTATQELAAAGVPLVAYTVNSPEVAARCFALGVAALFTDRLDCLGP